MLQRSGHPAFPNDPDLPGGTVEVGESLIQAMIREVNEEAGIIIPEGGVVELFSSSEYSGHGTRYGLYECHIGKRPEVYISWEHASFDWVDKTTLLENASAAKDTYMHMVASVITRLDLAREEMGGDN